ncbi:MAG: hypothetical protein FWD38_05595 [Oscillospiraceae bacterium]|nr:hypothetical protein [Oscillospiraceae bacterium]
MSDNMNIKIDTGKMKEAAGIVESQMNIITNCFASIRDDVNILKANNWESDSADIFIRGINKICNEQLDDNTVTAGSIIQTLKDYTANLNNTAAAFDTEDQKQNDKIASLKTSIFGV